MPSPQSSDGTTSHSASPSKNDGLAAGYPASGRGGKRERQPSILAGEGANESLREFQIIEQTRADIACATQEAIVDVLAHKARMALAQTGLSQLVVAGGVGANTLLRERLNKDIGKRGGKVFYPCLEFCTDNGAMIAFAGALRLAQRQGSKDYRFNVKPRWDLAEITVGFQPPVMGTTRNSSDISV